MIRKKKIRFLIVSGPTREPLDPVRFLSNYSTGVMGKCLAQAVKRRGHRLSWVRCPDDAETARGLLKKLRGLLPKNDVLIMAAAVCDVRPAAVSSGKIKKETLGSFRFVKNPDILAALSDRKRSDQVFIGFGLESKNLVDNGIRKMKTKNLELILLQQVTRKHTPFGDKKIEAICLSKNGVLKKFSKQSKNRIADYLVEQAESLFCLKPR